MVKDGKDFGVYDAKSGEDITRSVLTQIIVEEEGKGENLLPISFLRQLIGFYGDSMQRMLLPRYLEHSMKAFARNQEQMQNYMKEAFGGMFPFGQLEEMGKQNLAMFEQAMKMFSPFQGNDEAGAGDRPRPRAEDHPAKNGMAGPERKLDGMPKPRDANPTKRTTKTTHEPTR